MIKIVLNCKLIVKQALDKHDCDKVPLIVICIDSLITKFTHSLYKSNTCVYNTEHSLSKIFNNGGCFICS